MPSPPAGGSSITSSAHVTALLQSTPAQQEVERKSAPRPGRCEKRAAEFLTPQQQPQQPAAAAPRAQPAVRPSSGEQFIPEQQHLATARVQMRLVLEDNERRVSLCAVQQLRQRHLGALARTVAACHARVSACRSE